MEGYPGFSKGKSKTSKVNSTATSNDGESFVAFQFISPSCHIRGKRFAPITHRRQSHFFRQQAAERGVARAGGDAFHVALVGYLQERMDLVSCQANQAARFESKL